MTEQKIDDLINGLTEELKPVKCLFHPALRVLLWIVLSSAYVTFYAYSSGIRADFSVKMHESIYLFEMLLVGSLAVGAAFSSAFLSVPDMRGQKWLVTSTLTLLAVFTAWSVLRGAGEGLYMPKLEMDHCMGEGMFMAIIPVTVLLFMMRRGTTTKPILMTSMNMLAAGGLGYVGLRITCSMDTIQHVAISHLVPYVALGAVLGILARRLYRW